MESFRLRVHPLSLLFFRLTFCELDDHGSIHLDYVDTQPKRDCAAADGARLANKKLDAVSAGALMAARDGELVLVPFEA